VTALENAVVASVLMIIVAMAINVAAVLVTERGRTVNVALNVVLE